MNIIPTQAVVLAEKQRIPPRDECRVILAISQKKFERLEWISPAADHHVLLKKSAVVFAARTGCVTSMRILCATKMADANASDERGSPALHVASALGHLDTVRCLVEELNADLEQMDSNGDTAVWRAARQGEDAVVKFLIESEAILEHPMLNISLWEWAAETGPIQILQLLVRENTIGPATRNERLKTALHLAARGGSLEKVKLLLDEGQAELHAMDEDLRTPLFDACEKGHPCIVKFLLNCGACPNHKDRELQTPLHVASSGLRCGQLEAMVHLINRGAEVDAFSDTISTPLHVATTSGHKPGAMLLLDRGAEINHRDLAGRTPRVVAEAQGLNDLAAFFRMWEAAHLLIQAIEHEDIEEVRRLSSQVQLNAKAAEGGKSVLRFAVESAPCNLIQILVEDGIEDGFLEALNEQNSELSPLWKAVHAGDCQKLELLLYGRPKKEYRGQSGAEGLITRYAVEKLEKPFMKLREANGRTLLHSAAWKQSIDMVQSLVDFVARAARKYEYDYHSNENQYLDVKEMLSERDYIVIKDGDGRTAQDSARIGAQMTNHEFLKRVTTQISRVKRTLDKDALRLAWDMSGLAFALVGVFSLGANRTHAYASVAWKDRRRWLVEEARRSWIKNMSV